MAPSTSLECVSGSTPSAENASLPLKLSRQLSEDACVHGSTFNNGHYAYQQISCGRFRGESLELCAGEIQIIAESVNQSIHYRGHSTSRTRMFVIASEEPCNIHAFNKRLPAGRALTHPGHLDAEASAASGFSMTKLILDEAAFEHYMLTVERAPTEIHAREPRLLGNLEFARSLHGLCHVGLASLGSDAPCIAREAYSAFRSQIFELVGSAVASRATERIPGSCRSRIANAGRSFMLSRLDEALTVADVCCALSVSRRTLQYSFESIFGVTPLRYLHALRLNGVRRELITKGTDVFAQDVAARWGFWHLSRFASAYRQFFGELPSETQCRILATKSQPGRRRRAHIYGADETLARVTLAL